MKKLTILLILIISQLFSFSQNLDLIVTSEGKYIACKIDSTTSSYIYFQMKHDYNWISTSILLSDIKDHSRSTIDKDLYKFEYGTSFINAKKDTIINAKSLYEIPRNAIYAESAFLNLSVVYERMFPLTKKVGITAKGGMLIGIFFYHSTTNFITESSLLFGGPKHFFEPGCGVQLIPDEAPDLLLRLGYRYQANSGFLFKVSPIFAYIDSKYGFPDGWIVLPTLGFGYTF